MKTSLKEEKERIYQELMAEMYNSGLVDWYKTNYPDLTETEMFEGLPALVDRIVYMNDDSGWWSLIARDYRTHRIFSE